MTNENLHKVDISVYIKIFIILIVLTTLTILQPIVFHSDLSGTYGIQMIIAFTKVVLIVAYYMHIKGSSIIYKRLIFGTTALLFSIYIIMAIDTYVRHMHNDIFN